MEGKMSIYDRDPIMPFTGNGCGIAIAITIVVFGLLGVLIFLLNLIANTLFKLFS